MDGDSDDDFDDIWVSVRDQSVSILVEPFQIKLLTRMMSTSMVKLLMWLKISHMIITTFSIIITRSIQYNRKEVIYDKEQTARKEFPPWKKRGSDFVWDP